MANEWASRPFGELLATPLRNGLTKPTAVRGSGTKMVNMGELFEHSRIGNVPMDRVPMTDKEAETYLLAEFDLLFARQSLVFAGAGKCSICLDLHEPTTYEGHLIRARLDERIAHALFYYYYFSSRNGRVAIESIIEQVAAAGIRGSDLSRLPVPYPPLPEQRAIAYILGSLDDKIELNRRMNATLEELARALFQAWFVDFGPVRARLAGQETGLPDELADLFPAALVTSEVGEIPEGWKVKPIGELAEIVGGSTPSTTNPAFWDNGAHHWATPKDLSALQTWALLDTERRITDAGLRQISSGLLPVGTVLLSSRAPIGYLAIAEAPVAINQGFIAMKPRAHVSNLFLLLWTRFAHDQIVSRANGSTFLEISKAAFRPIPVVTPPSNIMSNFDRIARPLYARIVANERESRTLAALRDALLPKLVEGEVRVGDIAS